MIKIVTAFFFVSAFFLISCKDQEDFSLKGEKILAVSTITVINDIVKNIGGDKVDARSICQVGIDPHMYQPKPADPRLVSQSDIVFINGLTLEHWIEEMIKNAGGEKIEVTVTEGITPLTDESGYGDPDPHAWFNVEFVKVYAKNIADGMIKVDKENEEFYKTNLNDYLIKLDTLNNWIKEEIKKIPEKQRVLITSHDAFRYFGEAYGLEVHGLQGISTEAKVRTEDVKNLIDLIKERNIRSVFIETSVNPKLLEQISSETGATIGGTLYSDSVGDEGTPEGTYIGAVIHNVKTIVEALR
jgi:ABC-type Zn uptake system ZnuABC Zn-binding protein ZnuA